MSFRVTVNEIHRKTLCEASYPLIKQFEQEYPGGVCLCELIERADKDMLDQLNFLSRYFGSCVDPEHDFSEMSIEGKVILCTWNPQCVNQIGYDALPPEEKDLIDAVV